MSSRYTYIAKDVQQLISTHHTKCPKEILQQRGVVILPFSADTNILGMYKIIHRNRFVFYNPYVDEEVLSMVFAHELGHDLYHQTQAKDLKLVEYQLLNIADTMEIEANIFAAHLLISDEDIYELLPFNYTTAQMASQLKVSEELLHFKLQELALQDEQIQVYIYTYPNVFKKLGHK